MIGVFEKCLVKSRYSFTFLICVKAMSDKSLSQKYFLITI